MKTLLVIALVMSPVEVPSLLIPQSADADYWTALKCVAWHMELTGPHCPWLTNFRAEINWARCRYREARGWPSIKECRRLPPLEKCRGYVNFGNSHCCWLAIAERERPSIDMSEERADANWCLRFWGEACSAQCESSTWVSRRGSLQRLKELVGDEAWHAGAWPPPAPLWNWRELR
jgi:hypothetical protein